MNIDTPQNEQTKINELIDFFKRKGYHKIKALSYNVNFRFSATKDGQEIFIKTYNRPTDIDPQTNTKRALAEILCYQNLPQEYLIEFIEGSQKDQYVALKKVELTDLEKNSKTIKKLIEFGLNIIQKFDASFLPEYTWEDYEKFFIRLDRIAQAGAIENAQKVKDIFIENKEMISQSPKVFSHFDFNFLNIKKLNDKLVIFDFENAALDNAMVDMAVLYLEICDDPKLLKTFQQEIKKHDQYNEELLKFMVIRRAVIIINAGLSKNNDLGYDNPFRKKNIDILRKLINGGKLY